MSELTTEIDMSTSNEKETTTNVVATTQVNNPTTDAPSTKPLTTPMHTDGKTTNRRVTTESGDDTTAAPPDPTTKPATVTTMAPDLTTKSAAMTTESATMTTKSATMTTKSTTMTTKSATTTMPATELPNNELIESSGANMELKTPMDEFDEKEFQQAMSNNTKIYCNLEESNCGDTFEYISERDVIIYYTGDEPYFDRPTVETVAVAATGNTHVSFYIKNPYTSTEYVMTSEETENMLEIQKEDIDKDLGYQYEITKPYEKPTGFPAWATTLIVFIVICVFVFLFVFWRAKQLE
ncbi:uncharacterized protein [Antedon mediterranea]|uniref:uncharacterized protein n=1 Tax=Antedon mediterranea TaxID=105859 RepID=UPI003AF9F93F